MSDETPLGWQLDIEAPDWLESVILRLLAVDVPPTAIAKAFEIDVEPVRDLLLDVRVTKYGTAELGEAMHNLMWKAYEDTYILIQNSPPGQRLRMNMVLLSKASALVGGSTPDTMARMQNEFSTLMSEQRTTDHPSAPGSTIYEPVAPHAPVDNPEERPEG